MFDAGNESQPKRNGSLLSLGESLRAVRPAERQSRLTEALARVRAERPLSPAINPRPSVSTPDTPLPAAEAPAKILPSDAPPERLQAEPLVETPGRDAEYEPELTGVGKVDDRTAVESGSPAGWRPLIDPTRVVRGIFRSKKLIAATTLAGALLGVLVALNTPKTYESTTELLADPRDLKLVDKELTQNGISNEATLAIVDNQVRILTSGGILTKIVNRLNLAQDPEFNGQGPGEGLSGLIGKVKHVFLPGDGDIEPGRAQALATIALGEALSVERSGKTFVIVIRATTRDPEKSKLIADTMAKVFLESSGDIQSDAAGRAAGELTARLDDLRKGVEAAERKVEKFRAENDLVDAQGRLISDDELVKLNEQLTIARARTLELNARAASTRGVDVDAVLGGVIPEELASPGIQELRSQYSTLKGEADRAAVRLGPKHPTFLAVQAQLGGARDLIRTEIRRIVSSSQTELKRAVQLEQELSSRLAQLKVRSGSVSDQLVTLREMEREATAKRAVYESFLLRARETGEQQGINSANISVLSPAYAPLESSGPSRSMIAIAGTLIGFLAGVGAGGVRGTLDSLRTTAGNDATPRLLRPVGRRRRKKTAMFDSPEPAAEDLLPELVPEPEPAPPIAAQAEIPSQPEPAENTAEIDEIRASLRECREAIRALAETRTARRYF